MTTTLEATVIQPTDQVFLGGAIKHYRGRLSKSEISRRLNIDPSVISLWEDEARPVPHNRLHELATALEVDLPTLMASARLDRSSYRYSTRMSRTMVIPSVSGAVAELAPDPLPARPVTAPIQDMVEPEPEPEVTPVAPPAPVFVPMFSRTCAWWCVARHGPDDAHYPRRSVTITTIAEFGGRGGAAPYVPLHPLGADRVQQHVGPRPTPSQRPEPLAAPTRPCTLCGGRIVGGGAAAAHYESAQHRAASVAWAVVEAADEH